MSKIKINYEKYHIKPFPHFDQRIKVNKKVKENLQNPFYIAAHSFYPFIHYKKISYKFKNGTLSSPKERDIFYSGHMDGYIYKHYGEILNHKYNNTCIGKGIDHVSLVYRNNKMGKSNIHFAAEVINFISEQQQAFIFVSDFSSYFDSLDHAILKEKLIEVLEEQDKLSKDWWNVFKHITRYNWVEKEEVISDLERTKEKIARDKKSRERYYTPAEFREFRKRVNIKSNDTGVGIPQGTAISAVLANVYAIDLDQKLNQYASKYGGIYRRYSDDIIMVLPMTSDGQDSSNNHVSFIKSVVESNKVSMGDSKTSVLYYANNNIYEDYQRQRESKMDYLGFSFDGMTVKIREKSLFKYYHRTYKKINSINWASVKKEKKVGRKKLYLLYSHLGRNYKGHGNFISYCKKAHAVFEENTKIESLINQQIKRHWKKIQKRLVDV
ncbi:reverse transcriptase domain-containing protein [Bacillus cereus]|nr:reverse transcriptase domain-containing protein [Bacillus cereus]